MKKMTLLRKVKSLLIVSGFLFSNCVFGSGSTIEKEKQICCTISGDRKVGDTVPETALTLINNYGGEQRLFDFKGKMIILVFWGTWCYPCYKILSKLDSLQRKFKNNIQIILVTSAGPHDTRRKVNDAVMSINKKINDFRIPVAIDDAILKQLFPHQTIPHYVWIGSDRVVKAIGNSRPLTEENIISTLNECPGNNVIPDLIL